MHERLVRRAAAQQGTGRRLSLKGRSQPSTPRADCGLSPQERNRKGSSKKADAEGIDQFFRGASAAKVGSEPKPTAAGVGACSKGRHVTCGQKLTFIGLTDPIPKLVQSDHLCAMQHRSRKDRERRTVLSLEDKVEFQLSFGNIAEFFNLFEGHGIGKIGPDGRSKRFRDMIDCSIFSR
jgi:hypothetical protein